MSNEIDLDKGDEKRAARIAARQEKEKKTSDKPRSGGTRQRSTPGVRVESELKGRLDNVWSKLAENRVAHGDNELAEVFAEDGPVMTQSLVALTRGLTWLRTPLLVVLSLVEPFLAFGKIARILWGRWQERRAMVPMEQPTEEPAKEPVSAYDYGSPEPVT